MMAGRLNDGYSRLTCWSVFEDGIPTKCDCSSCWNYLALEYIRYILLNEEENTYICASLEDNWLVARAFGVCKCAHRLGGFVFKAGEKLIQAIVTEGLEEPFTIKIKPR
mgnify:FL=1